MNIQSLLIKAAGAEQIFPVLIAKREREKGLDRSKMVVFS